MATSVLHIRSDRFDGGSCYKNHGSEIKHKRGRQKTVKWPINEKLCEVCYFLLDDAPSILGMQQVHNVPYYPESKNLVGDYPSEAKRTRFTRVAQPQGSLAPGFGLSMAKSLHVPKVELETPMICGTLWHCPQMFIPDDSWQWAGGEDSMEIASQKRRETRVFEAFYPRLASVPDSPAEPPESPADNSCMSSIPLIPLEEDETEDVEPEEMIENNNTDNAGPDCKMMFDALKLRTETLNPKEDGILPQYSMAETVELNQSKVTSDADSNIAAVAAAACMVVRSLGDSDLVDEKLLLALLKNPSLLKSLTFSNNIMLNKSQAKNNAVGSQVSQGPITSLLGKQPPDHGAHLGSSPVSVLARWDEGAFTENSHGTTLLANEDAYAQQCVIEISNPAIATPPITSLPSQATHKTTHVGRDISQPGVEIVTRAIPELCKNGPFKAPFRQEFSRPHASKPEEDARLSCENVSHNNLVSASCRMPSAASSSYSVLSTSLSNSEHPRRAWSCREPPPRKLAHDLDTKLVQEKMVAPPSRGGGRAKRFCMYFNSPRGCRNGSSCAFVHQSLDSELNATAL